MSETVVESPSCSTKRDLIRFARECEKTDGVTRITAPKNFEWETATTETPEDLALAYRVGLSKYVSRVWSLIKQDSRFPVLENFGVLLGANFNQILLETGNRDTSKSEEIENAFGKIRKLTISLLAVVTNDLSKESVLDDWSSILWDYRMRCLELDLPETRGGILGRPFESISDLVSGGFATEISEILTQAKLSLIALFADTKIPQKRVSAIKTLMDVDTLTSVIEYAQREAIGGSILQVPYLNSTVNLYMTKQIRPEINYTNVRCPFLHYQGSPEEILNTSLGIKTKDKDFTGPLAKVKTGCPAMLDQDVNVILELFTVCRETLKLDTYPVIAEFLPRYLRD
jgi:hypothetical protein